TERPAEHPHGGEYAYSAQRASAVTARNPRHLAQGDRRDEERCETDHDCACDREIGGTAAEGVTYRRGADREVAPVLDRVEGAVERDEEAVVEELDQNQHAEQRADQPRYETPPPGRQGEGKADGEESLERDPQEGARGEKRRPDRRHERGPDDHHGEQC